jgi:hypothetical protein
MNGGRRRAVWVLSSRAVQPLPGATTPRAQGDESNKAPRVSRMSPVSVETGSLRRRRVDGAPR